MAWERSVVELYFDRARTISAQRLRQKAQLRWPATESRCAATCGSIPRGDDVRPDRLRRADGDRRPVLAVDHRRPAYRGWLHAGPDGRRD